MMGNARTLYQELITKHGPTAKGVGWKDLQEQWQRFQVILEMVPWEEIEVESTLDVGCGYGELVEYLATWFQVYMSHEGYERLKYLGIDNNPLAVKAAKDRYDIHGSRLSPGRPAFMLGDITEILIKNPNWDLVIGSGVLSYHEMADKLMILKSMWDFTRKVMVFNIRCRDAYLADLSMLMGMFTSAKWAVRHDYGLDEMTVMVRR